MKTAPPRYLLLGSASGRRRSILAGLGLTFDVDIPCVDEVHIETDPARTARDNAARKMEWCRERHPRAHIITADTIVAFRGRCVIKPASRAEAADFLRMFSGESQIVHTGLALSSPGRAPDALHVVESVVRFRPLDEAVIADYLRLVDPMDKAGAYDIDQHGDLIVESYEGSYTNIMGLPLEMVTPWLTREGWL